MITYATDPYEPQRSRREMAEDAGYCAHRDDLLPPAQHLTLAADDPWMVALAASAEEAREMQGWSV